jgi:RNA polymerase sigma factor (sigma-70 family)
MFLDEANLIQRARKGDPAALAEIYARYQPAIYRYIFYRVGDAGTAEDLSGEAFVRLVEGIDRFPRQGGMLLAWLYSIAHNLVADRHRRAGQSPPLRPEEQPAADVTDPQETTEQRPTPQHLTAAIARLTDDQRQVILLKFIEGLDDEPVARILGQPADAVQLLQQQALTALSTAWRDVARTLEFPQFQEEELERLRKEFKQNVAHELRTPLTLIRGYNELLLSGTLGPLQPKQQDALEVICDRIEELSRVIHNLTTSREISKETLTVAPFSVPGWVESALDQCSRIAKRAEIRFEVDLADDLPPILGDQKQLCVALSRLLDNAIKFSPDGGLVRVRAWSDGGWVHVAVQDQGAGITPEHLEGIFDRFYQADGSTTQRFGGLSIGLAVAQAVVEAHSGQVWAASEGPGKGSTFTLALPAGAAKSQPPPLSPSPEHDQPLEQGLIQALDESLLPLEEGRATLEECLARYPEYTANLRPLLEVALNVRRAPRLVSSQAAFAAGKRRTLEALAEKKRQRAASPSPLARLAKQAAVIFERRERPAVSRRVLALQPALTAVLALVLFVFGSLFLLTWPGGTVARAGTLVQVSGAVEVLPVGGEVWRLSSVGDRIETGDRIRTGRFSAATLAFFDGSTTDLGANTEATVAQMSSRRDGGGKVIALHQWMGRIYNRVNHLSDADSHFRVETPTAVTAVRGTEFAVAIESDGATSVVVIKGVVNVMARETTVVVLAGQETKVLPEQPPLAASPVRTVTSTPWPASPLPGPTLETPYRTRTPGPTETPGPYRVAERTVAPTPSETAVWTMTPTPIETPETPEPPGPTETPEPTAPPPPGPAPTQQRPTPTPMSTGTPTPTSTPTPTPTPTPVPTSTPSATPTSTPVVTHTPTPTATSTFTPTVTHTPTPTATSTFTPTVTHTPTPTATPAFTPTVIYRPTPIATSAFTPTVAHTPTPTTTSSYTSTAAHALILTSTPEPTNTPPPGTARNVITYSVCAHPPTSSCSRRWKLVATETRAPGQAV